MKQARRLSYSGGEGKPMSKRIQTGVRGLDRVLGGGFLAHNSILLKGAPGTSYNIQVRHSFPLGIYTIDSRSGTLPPGGIAEVEFAGLRPRRPELNVIAVSFGDNANFDTIAGTIYGTIA